VRHLTLCALLATGLLAAGCADERSAPAMQSSSPATFGTVSPRAPDPGRTAGATDSPTTGSASNAASGSQVLGNQVR
jgi:hypothetical protein